MQERNQRVEATKEITEALGNDRYKMNLAQCATDKLEPGTDEHHNCRRETNKNRCMWWWGRGYAAKTKEH
jgi:hypothetical protein